MKVIIPARYSSTRFPGKSLADMGGKPMIQVVYEHAAEAVGVKNVFVATDDLRIRDAVASFGGNAIMTSPDHANGTERVRECADMLHVADDEIVVNMQGDEPLLGPEALKSLMRAFADEEVEMVSLMRRCDDVEEMTNPNVVKVVTDIYSNAVYFSRCPIPYDRDDADIVRFAHIGVYGYKRRLLDEIAQMPRSPLEKSESLEQLRVLENGRKIRMVEVEYDGFGVDTPEQLDAALKMLEVRNA